MLKWRPVRRLALAVWLGSPALALAQPAPPPPDQPAPPADQAPPEEPPARTITVRGRVINVLGRPVRGATIGLEGEPEIGRTDRNGHYVVKAPIGSTLVIDARGRTVYEGGALDGAALEALTKALAR